MSRPIISGGRPGSSDRSPTRSSRAERMADSLFGNRRASAGEVNDVGVAHRSAGALADSLFHSSKASRPGGATVPPPPPPVWELGHWHHQSRRMRRSPPARGWDVLAPWTDEWPAFGGRDVLAPWTDEWPAFGGRPPEFRWEFGRASSGLDRLVRGWPLHAAQVLRIG